MKSRAAANARRYPSRIPFSPSSSSGGLPNLPAVSVLTICTEQTAVSPCGSTAGGSGACGATGGTKGRSGRWSSGAAVGAGEREDEHPGDDLNDQGDREGVEQDLDVGALVGRVQQQTLRPCVPDARGAQVLRVGRGVVEVEHQRRGLGGRVGVEHVG